jgi:protein ImuB
VFACVHGEGPGLVEVGRAFSPLVEEVDARTVVFSVGGLGRLIGDARAIGAAISRRGGAARVAIASNPSAAVLAAQHLPGVTIIPPGQEARALAGIPVGALPAEPEVLLTLERWGVRTLGELAALPEMGLVERWGEAGTRLRRIALGEGDQFLNILRPAVEYVRAQELEDPVALLEPLLFLLSAQLHDLAGELQRNGLAARRITIVLKLEDGSEFRRVLELPFPMRDPKALLKQVQLSLEAKPPGAATEAVQVRLDPGEPRVVQGGLFLPAVPDPEKLHTLLERLGALAGKDRVGSPEILNTHRPDAYCFRPCAFEQSEPKEEQPAKLRLAFRYFRPPLTARVVLQNGRLQRIISERVSGEVIRAAGPWRSSGEWWSETVWNRDEWDVVLADQTAHRIYCSGKQWFLDGSYD